MWVKIDDGLMEHPKMIAIGIQGRALWLAGLCYANRQTTDGFIPEYMVRELARQAGVTDLKGTLAKMTTTYKGNRSPVWHVADEGYQIHDYGEYQFTAEKIAEMNATNVARARKAANARWHKQKDAQSMLASTPASNLASTRESIQTRMLGSCPESRTRTHKKNLPRNAEGVAAPQGAGPAAHVSLEELPDPFEAEGEWEVDDAWYEEHVT